MKRSFLQKSWAPTLTVLLVTLLVFVSLGNVTSVQGQELAGEPEPVRGIEGEEEEETLALSPFWHPRLQQWSSLIVEEALYRSLDPDFLASLVWMESAGRPLAEGPKGAVGLMQVMPREEGFSWRPSREALLDPSINLFWGTRTLATVVRQGQGNVFTALAAYNGGWDKVTTPGPRLFATQILRNYASAIAMRHALADEDQWVAFFAVRAPDIQGPIWIADSARDDVYFFGESNSFPEGDPLIPLYLPPTSIVAHCEDESGALCDVGMWLYLASTDRWFTP